ncbi:MAG: pantoate--beta-alanine ligase [Deltaproteobacteria bacterium CG03_land_8_20_14_0_80_45_14]|nr:MAG: pantoate--beta-alanine ligase [Deltaproteobacteria bacterium CG03_land_8_20_14_0_80_45_14]
MQVVRKIEGMQEISDRLRQEDKRIGFVPTMGYLHEGHLSLVRKAKDLCDSVVVSIFVNPTQFGPGEDFERYPRDEEGDKSKLEQEGVDFLFIPEIRDMYLLGYQTYVDVTEVSKGLCGDFRPGHFRGVATVVAKLFNLVKPHVAIFGEKDYQQLLVIKRMAKDLNFDIEIIPGRTVREEDGIAMSSRNTYLSPEARKKATVLYRSLRKGKELFDSGERDVSTLSQTIRKEIESEEDVTLQYVEIRDAETLERIERVNRPAAIAVAAIIGSVRLIDNIIIGRDQG